jgi:phospholipid transport system substrate-binding protein
MMILRRLSMLVMLSVLGFGAAAGAQPRGGPREFVVNRHRAVMQLLQRRPDAGTPELAARDRAVANVLNGMLDIEELARRALEPYWAQQPAAQQQEFTALLRQLIERNYRENLDSTLGWTVRWEDALIDDAGTGASVRSTAQSQNARERPVNVEYRLQRRADAWIVYDIVTNGASLVQSYHDAYTRIIRDPTKGFPELLRRLRARVAQGPSAAAPR